MRAATIAPVYVKSVLKGAIKKGYHPEEILRTLRLPIQILTNHKLRMSTIDFARLSRAISALTRDETYGLLEKPTPHVLESSLSIEKRVHKRAVEQSLTLPWKITKSHKQSLILGA